ncbi:MAG: Hpt domain-containing protein [Planctomycetia bacterium]|nr:Hpt domain-containing protein [Planctomycetia bacterium]
MMAVSKAPIDPVGELGLGVCHSTLTSDPDMAELLAMFVSELPERLVDIRQAAQGHNWQEVRRLAHQLRGAGGSYGFPLLTTAAGQVETIARDKVNIGELRAALDQLTAVSQRLRA